MTSIERTARASRSMDRSFPTLDIDYAEHPAFSNSGRDVKWDDERVATQVNEIDRCIDDLIQKGLTDAEIVAQFNSVIAGKISDLGAFVRERLPDGRFREMVMDAFKSCGADILLDLRCKGVANFYQPHALKRPEERAHVESMKRSGFARTSVDPEDLGALRKVLQSAREELTREMAEGGEGRMTRSFGRFDPPSRQAIKILKKVGIWKAAENYKRLSLEFAYCSLELSAPSQNWYKDCYSDMGLPTSDTAYLHYDGDYGVIKALIYLNDVGAQNGAFNIVSDSLKWKRSVFVDTLLIKLDHASGVEGYHGYRGNYYRPRFKLPGLRREFTMLPRLFQGSSHFGDDLVNGSPMSELLLTAEQPINGPAGTCVLFDGYGGLHRGGLSTAGERWVINVGLRARIATATPEHRKRKAMEWIVASSRLVGLYPLLKKLRQLVR